MAKGFASDLVVHLSDSLLGCNISFSHTFAACILMLPLHTDQQQHRHWGIDAEAMSYQMKGARCNAQGRGIDKE
jgi:hypothetical protein